MDVLPACMFAHLCSAQGEQRRVFHPLNYSYRWLWTTMWESGSFVLLSTEPPLQPLNYKWKQMTQLHAKPKLKSQVRRSSLLSMTSKTTLTEGDKLELVVLRICSGGTHLVQGPVHSIITSGAASTLALRWEDRSSRSSEICLGYRRPQFSNKKNPPELPNLEYLNEKLKDKAETKV